MTNTYMKMCSASVIIRETQIKTTLRHHLIPVRMTIIKKTKDHRCWQGCIEKRTLMHFCWRCELVQPLWKTVWKFLKKVKIELRYDPAAVFLDNVRE